MTFVIDMQPVGRRAEVEPGASLLDAARSAGVGLVSLCGGEGWCESCLVRLIQGKLSPPTLYEEAEISAADLLKGVRLACQAQPLSDVKIEIPPSSLSTPQRLQVEGQEQEVGVEPAVQAVDLSLEPPSLYDLRSDATRLKAALDAAGRPDTAIGMEVLSDLSSRLRRSAWRARLALRHGTAVAVLPAGSRLYGLAADIGTTKLAVYLLDLESGATLEKTGAMNPQIAYGEDVMSRISFTREHAGGRETLQRALVETLNGIIAGMCQRQGIDPEQIVEGVFVGNTAMHHLFAGIPVEQLGLSPCVPAVSDAIDVPAKTVGIQIAPAASIHLLPNIAGYVGADHVAMLLATGLWQAEGTAIGVDIGTNTEISLVSRGKVLSCSAASGPAFEGAHIRGGMRAAAGSVERVQITDGQVYVFTIDNEPAVGICGSGILDAVAEMYAAGVLNEKGAMQANHPLVRSAGPLPEFVLVPAEKTGHGREIALNRKDINEIQLAKSAIRTGIEILMDAAHVQPSDVQDFIIAGAFGTYINVASALKIGMFPDLPLERFRQVGNAAGIGAKQSLISLSQRRLAAEIAQRVRYIELTTYPDFQKRFLRNMYL